MKTSPFKEGELDWNVQLILYGLSNKLRKKDMIILSKDVRENLG